MKTYAPLDVCFDRGEGVWLFDDKGTKYLDALSGIAVCGLGHAHPAVTRAIQAQAEKLLHTSNLYCIRNQQRLANQLSEKSGMDRVFFSNSGAEANEAAIKLARLYGNQQNIDNPSIIVTDGSFHGRTLATLSATGNRKVQAGFEPLVHGFVRAPYNNTDAIRSIAQSSNNIVAILVEPVQGEGGINIPDENYLNELRAICDENNWLLMLDEIQTGMGRTGKWFAFQHSKIKPDIMTLAKGLGNGVPIGACIANGKAAELFQPGNHGSTFGGNPLTCAAASAVVETITEEKLCQRAAQSGKRMINAFESQLSDVDGVKAIRGMGLMIGIELDRDCPELVALALQQHCLINVTAGHVIRLLPPLIMSDEQADTVVSTVCALVKDFLK
ncbi:MAG TPA: aspartate aminotransferase family protein [Gammaproteobacteria bacterium]|nr:aspartate aminotransferase family protein [Gammaproteobacteria bacterium]